MRKAFVYWSLGLIGVSWLSGCSSLRDDRDARAEKVRYAETRVRNERTAAVQPGPIDTSGYANTGGRPSVTKTPSQEAALSKSTSTPIATPGEFLPESEKAATAPPILGKLATVEGGSASRKNESRPAELPRVSQSPDKASTKVKLPSVEPKVAIEILQGGQIDGPSPKSDEKPALKNDSQITLGQTENYKTVTGQVNLYRKTWRLRYAAIDQEDVHGGVLVLDGDDLSKLRDGQHIRVRGTLVPPTDRNGSAHYRVEAMEMLD